jgi:phosphatidylglycerophosphate synthase
LLDLWKRPFDSRFALVLGLIILLAVQAIWSAFQAERNRGGANTNFTMGIADWFTILRGLFISVLGGVFFSFQPERWLAWIPGLICLMVIAADGLDGYLARRWGQTSAFGEVLDREIDAMTTIIAALLAYQYGKVPACYLFVAGLFYIFKIGLWLRHKLGQTVQILKNSTYRKTVGGLNSIFLALALFPVFGPPATSVLAIAFMILVSVSFVRDWLTITSRISIG